MKRLVLLLMVLTCLLTLAACGNNNEEIPDGGQGAQSNEQDASLSGLEDLNAGDENNAGAIVRMASMEAEDIKYLSSTFDNITPEQLADALNTAAEHRVDAVEGNPTFYDLTAYLSGGPEGYGSDDEHLIFWAGLEENIVQVLYRDGEGNNEEVSLSDSTLYWLIRNNYKSSGVIDENAYSRYGDILETRAQQSVEQTAGMTGASAFTGYKVLHFDHIDTFDIGEDTYEVYSWDVAFLTDDVMGVGWAGGMYLDADACVRAFEQDTYFVVKNPDEDVEEHRFLFWDLYTGPDEAGGRENAKNTIERAFSET